MEMDKAGLLNGLCGFIKCVGPDFALDFKD